MMKFIAHTMVVCILAAAVTSCNQTSSPTVTDAASTASAAPTMLADISGVWRASDGTMISIVYDDKRLRLLFGSDAIPVKVGTIDQQNHTTNLNVTLADGKPGIWTVSKVFDSADRAAFNLQITLHDGTQDQLSFVRKISTDDLNVIAAAETRIRAGSVSEAMAQPVVQQPTYNVEPASQPQHIESDSAAISWAPSFDCTKASAGSERLVCSSKELSAADVALAQAYRSARAASIDKKWLQQQQNEWRKTVRDACSDVQCMLSAYEQRIAELR
ncbi:MAG: lysozyme inhibitor LprI family protein [Pseudoxanthomonas suwonensis]|nr:lysozyme inhibitor LprI family protein [Pseudoxanthomonas suwonensis]